MTQPRHSGATVALEQCTVVKLQSATAAVVELTRTRLGQRVADDCGDFLVPAILEHDGAAGRIVFERFHELCRLDGAGAACGVPARAFACAGRALARIHGSRAATQSGDVFSHGDFGLDNVLWSPQRDALVVIDWSDAAWVPRRCVDHVRPAAVDLAIFLVGLFYRSGLRPRAVWRRRAADDFLAAYRDAGPGIDSSDLHGWVERLTSIKQSGRRTWLGRLLHAGAVHELRHRVRALA